MKKLTLNLFKNTIYYNPPGEILCCDKHPSRKPAREPSKGVATLGIVVTWLALI